MPPSSPSRTGLAHAIAAYLAWGLFPLYWRQLSRIPALEVLGHRIVWSCLFVALLLTLGRRWAEVRAALRSRTSLLILLATTALISVNWFLFIWAIEQEHVTQASLGYYINPLVNVLLARLFLGERLRPLQIVAALLAGTGVLYLVATVGTFPWISLALALTFGLYGLLRKVVAVEALPGLAIETALAAPAALLLLAWLPTPEGRGLLGWDLRDAFFLLGSGAATALPLLAFASGARRLRYTTMGMLQYIAPTLQLLIAVAYGEPFSRHHLVTFAFIWSAVALYLASDLRPAARVPAAPALTPTEE